MALLQLRVLGFGLLQDGDVGIGVFQSLPVKWSFVGVRVRVGFQTISPLIRV